MNRTYFDIPFNKKDEIKQNSTNTLRWDKTRKKWYVDLELDQLLDPDLYKYIVMPIKVPFSKKDEVKAHGAKWDPVIKSWYYSDDPTGYFNTFKDITTQ